MNSDIPEEELLESHNAKQIAEALLFSSHEPLPISKFREILSLSSKEVESLLEELKAELIEQERAYQLEQVAEGYLLTSLPELSTYIERLQGTRKPEKLTQAALETLSIIAYKQPITRPNIDRIRGVDSSGILHTLQERGLIESAGVLEVPGRPALWKTSNEFLRYFGLNDLSHLPNLETAEVP